MIQAATGISTRVDSEEAGAEAGRRASAGLGSRAADWCVAFVTSEHEQRLGPLLASLAEAAGTPYVVGCSAAGVMAEGLEVEDGPAVAVLAAASDRLRATPFLFLDDGDRGLTTGTRLGQRLAASRNSRDLLLLLADPHRLSPDRLLQGLDATLGHVSVAGALASARGRGGTFQFSGGEIGEGGVAGLRLGGDFGFHVAVAQGCRPLGEPLTVTRSHDNLVLEIEGRPALEVLEEQAPPHVLEDPSLMLRAVAVGILPERGPEDYWVRNIVAADPDTGVLAIADEVEEGQRIVFTLREGRAAREDLARVLARARASSAGSPYRLGFYFNCLARGRSLYQDDGVDAALLAESFPGLPILGMFGNAEIAALRGVNRVFTDAGVLVLISE